MQEELNISRVRRRRVQAGVVLVDVEEQECARAAGHGRFCAPQHRRLALVSRRSLAREAFVVAEFLEAPALRPVALRGDEDERVGAEGLVDARFDGGLQIRAAADLR
jgi:hypothetical protein